MIKILLPLFFISTNTFAFDVEKVYVPEKIQMPKLETDEDKFANNRKMNFFVVKKELKDKRANTNIYSLQDNERKTMGLLAPFNDTQESLFILRNLSLTGKKVNVAVVDDGISDFSNLVNVVKNDSCIYDYKQEEGFVKQPSNTDDFYGHGSNMISMIGHKITGVAPNSRIFSIKVSNREEQKNGSVLKGLGCAIKYNPDIVNLSQIGWEKNSFIKNKNLDKNEEKYKDVYLDFIKKDILLVAAMNNKDINLSKDFYRVNDSVNNVFAIKDFNKQVLIVKSISSIPTGYPGESKELSDRTITVPLNTWYGWCGKENTLDNMCYSRSGNSSVTAVVSGIAALIKEANPTLKGREIGEIILKTANKENPSYKKNDCGDNKKLNCGEFTFGAGIIDPTAAVRMAKSMLNKK